MSRDIVRILVSGVMCDVDGTEPVRQPDTPDTAITAMTLADAFGAASLPLPGPAATSGASWRLIPVASPAV